jgi:hypothetical protein
MRQMTVFVNLFQNLGSGYMKLLPEFQIESIYLIEKKKREDKISLYLRADLSPAQRACSPPFDNSFLKYLKKKIVARLPV